jgi:phage shock protein E
MGLMDLFRRTPRGPTTADLLAQGALVVDVRSNSEFKSGHVKGAKNVPLNQLGSFMRQRKPADGPVVTCCASGMRSGKAASKFAERGYTVVNGGPWTRVQREMAKVR